VSFTNPIVQNPYPYAYALTAASPNTLYETVESLVPGVYTITFSGGGTLNVDFYNGSTFIGNANGTSPILYNLGSQATNFEFWCSTSANIVISLTALALTETSGTLYTYTNSQTISLVGNAYVVLVGGGGGGGSSNYNSIGGSGGGSGGVASGRLYLTGSSYLTIGAGGTSAPFQNSNGGAGGATSLLTLVANGGGAGLTHTGTGAAGGAAGSPNGGAGGASNNSGGLTGSASGNKNATFSFFSSGTTGGGGGASGGTGAGSGIGTGGNGAVGTNAGTGSGYGSGGGGLLANPNGTSGAGAPGIAYIVL